MDWPFVETKEVVGGYLIAWPYCYTMVLTSPIQDLASQVHLNEMGTLCLQLL